jgi:hypothetical protein
MKKIRLCPVMNEKSLSLPVQPNISSVTFIFLELYLILGFKCKEGECGIEDLRVDVLSLDAIQKEVAVAEKEKEE